MFWVIIGCARRESNPQPTGFEPVASAGIGPRAQKALLCARDAGERARRRELTVHTEGFEPSLDGFSNRCHFRWLGYACDCGGRSRTCIDGLMRPVCHSDLRGSHPRNRTGHLAFGTRRFLRQPRWELHQSLETPSGIAPARAALQATLRTCERRRDEETVGAAGIAPATTRLSAECSAAELRARGDTAPCHLRHGRSTGGTGGSRTLIRE